MRIARIRLSDKTSRLRPRRAAPTLGQTYEPEVLVEVREWIRPASASPPYYNRPTQDGLSGHFVLRAIGKRFRKDPTAGCEKVVGIRFALDSSLEEGGFELLVPAGKMTSRAAV